LGGVAGDHQEARPHRGGGDQAIVGRRAHHRLEFQPDSPAGAVWIAPSRRFAQGGQVETLARIDAADHVASTVQQAEHRLGGEADIGVDEQQVGRRRGQEPHQHAGAGASNQRLAAAEVEGESNAACGAGRPQRQQRLRIDHMRLAAVAGGGEQDDGSFSGHGRTRIAKGPWYDRTVAHGHVRGVAD
jgi:hypothetical protein